MKTVIIAAATLAVGFAIAYFGIPRGNHQVPAGESTIKQQYTCGMHPEIVTDEPGYCPICEMKLTPKKEGGDRSGSVMIDPLTQQNMGLVTVLATYRPLAKTVHAFGKVAFSEPLIYSVNLKIDGWIERFFVDHEGERVYRGQPLLEVYSPALIAAQREFLIAHESSSKGGDTPSGSSAVNMTDLMQASRSRLINWDISDDQIERLKSSGEVLRTMTIRAHADGVVIAKTVSEGDHLKPGAQLYQIADLSTVWVIAHIYEQDIPFINLGQKATLALPNLGGEELTATISYISPFLDAHGQVETRLDVDNADYRLKPEMYAEVSISSELEGDRLTIPRSAVINSGARQVVYVASGGGNYQPRLIRTGVVGDGDFVEILSGLHGDERVVVSGQFMLDSESRLSEALADGYKAEHDHSHGKSHEPTIKEHSPSGVYTCPMPSHYHVLQYGEGDCPECGMALVPVEETDNRAVYVCPMAECGVVQDHEGSCRVCGMDLVIYQPEGSHDQ